MHNHALRTECDRVSIITKLVANRQLTLSEGAHCAIDFGQGLMMLRYGVEATRGPAPWVEDHQVRMGSRGSGSGR